MLDELGEFGLELVLELVGERESVHLLGVLEQERLANVRLGVARRVAQCQSAALHAGHVGRHVLERVLDELVDGVRDAVELVALGLDHVRDAHALLLGLLLLLLMMRLACCCLALLTNVRVLLLVILVVVIVMVRSDGVVPIIVVVAEVVVEHELTIVQIVCHLPFTYRDNTSLN